MCAYQPLLGFRDFYPKDQRVLNYLCETVRRTARSFGFEEYSAPVLESLELFTAKSGDEITEQLFNFVDKGGRAVALRPEMTPSIARIVGTNFSALKKPIKWFNIAENFRYERPQKGRLRAFYQFNLDIFGEDSCFADAEVISLLIFILRNLRLSNFCVRLSDRQLWVALLCACRVSKEDIVPVLSVIDKSERENAEKIRQRLLQMSPNYDDLLYSNITKLKNIRSLESLNRFVDNNEVVVGSSEVEERVLKLKNLLNILDDFGVLNDVVVDFGIVRGLAYYTGFVFEVFDKEFSTRALAGGGRYDGLTEKLGYQSIPAVGAAIGDVTLTNFLEKNGSLPNCEKVLDCFVVFDNTCRKWALQITNLLRNNGFCTDYLLHEASLDKQFKSAINSHARFAIICGEQENERGEIKVKDLGSRKENFVSQDDLVRYLRAEGDGNR